MEKLDLIISIAGLAIIFVGSVGYMFSRSFRKSNVHNTSIAEPVAEVATQSGMNPVILENSLQEPVMTESASSEKNEENKENLVPSKPVSLNLFESEEWAAIVKKTFKQRTDLNRQRLSDQQRRLGGLVVIHVMAPQNMAFYGGDVLEVLTHLGLRFGDRRIFHKFNEQGQKLFSIAQAVEPGCFDINNMTLISVRGLSCFFDLSAASNPKQAFRNLLACVHEIAHYLRAEILDEHYRPLTQETIAQILKKIKVDEPVEAVEVV